MVTLLVATRSVGKAREAKALLEAAGVTVVLPADQGLAELPEEEHLEVGTTFAENAVAKARYFARRSGMPTVADDSGLEVTALGNAPGVQSKRWAGAFGVPLAVDQANNAHLLSELAGVPDGERQAQYRCALTLIDPEGGRLVVVEGVVRGHILTEPRGTNGFGYDPLFFCDLLGKSFGQATAEEKDRVSHRAEAFRALLEEICPAPFNTVKGQL